MYFDLFYQYFIYDFAEKKFSLRGILTKPVF